MSCEACGWNQMLPDDPICPECGAKQGSAPTPDGSGSPPAEETGCAQALGVAIAIVILLAVVVAILIGVHEGLHYLTC